jgi:hypothetical protein
MSIPLEVRAPQGAGPHELVAALPFQDLDAQINALVTDADAVRARD